MYALRWSLVGAVCMRRLYAAILDYVRRKENEK
jgi:hypothetical protein